MGGFLLLLALIFSIFVWPVWMIRRMRKVRSMMAERDRAERAKPPELATTEAVKTVGGLTYSKAFDAHDELLEATKRGGERSIHKDLEGRR
jgi:hypothetical protein